MRLDADKQEPPRERATQTTKVMVRPEQTSCQLDGNTVGRQIFNRQEEIKNEQTLAKRKRRRRPMEMEWQVCVAHLA